MTLAKTRCSTAEEKKKGVLSEEVKTQNTPTTPLLLRPPHPAVGYYTLHNIERHKTTEARTRWKRRRSCASTTTATAASARDVAVAAAESATTTTVRSSRRRRRRRRRRRLPRRPRRAETTTTIATAPPPRGRRRSSARSGRIRTWRPCPCAR